MHKFVRNLLSEWRKLDLPLGRRVFVVAVSGGADSTALALALCDLKKRNKLDLRFVLAHFDHGLRGSESDADAQFVRNLAEKFDLELVLQKGTVSRTGNLEQNARRARYRFLSETARSLDAFGILTAHTVNDQAETFLLNLIRGSGMTGLSGMKPVSLNSGFQAATDENDSPVTLIRPLLLWARREDTENYCRAAGVDYRSDSMNEDLRFKRVRVRRVLIPHLKDFNPKIIETLAQTARLIQLERADSPENADLTPIECGEDLILKDLKTLPKVVVYRVLRRWLEMKRGNLRRLELKHIEAIEHLILSRKSGKIVELPNGEAVIKQGGKLSWIGKNIENVE